MKGAETTGIALVTEGKVVIVLYRKRIDFLYIDCCVKRFGDRVTEKSVRIVGPIRTLEERRTYRPLGVNISDRKSGTERTKIVKSGS